MNLKQLKPRKALNKAYLKLKPNREDIEHFKTNLIQLLDKISDTESEEHHKNLIITFLRDTYFKDNHYINTKDRADLVIHNGKNRASSVGVIIETKKPSNKWEMITPTEINAKAFHELLLYYLRERITNNNLEMRYLIITNIHEWYIFDANVMERNFAQNRELVRQFKDFENKILSGTKTEFFYDKIAYPFINSLQHDIEYTYFDIRDYEKPLRNNNPKDDNKLIALFKLLSPEHLLKLPFANDSNTLDKRFYGELLHIMGLSETKEGGKKVIEREVEGKRNVGSLLENAINELDSLDKIGRLDRPSLFGSNMQERLFNVGLELSITWMNRILFMKLLEAQLIKYHKGDRSYEFLNIAKIESYDDLNSLFFKVLARKLQDRGETTKEKFHKVPYLNSSLFEPTELEHTTLLVSNLGDNRQMPIYSATVLKDKGGKRRTGTMNPLQYLFEFLDAYDFTSEGSEEIQEDNKTLINASVLGLIFEKINGYKDGSFFTPGFITMYMCRETIRKAVLQKFSEVKGWQCENMAQLYNKINDTDEANDIVNSLKICDPAVGSGHFLVSALNEIIAIKNDLRILKDREGLRLKEYHVGVENDELIVTDEEGVIFEYNPTSRESQRIQEALFHEKQTIIENCLFGVDINPNSVKICRLRLWIELLKNAYYIKADSVKPSSPVCFAESDEVRNDFKLPHADELQTLPNIDINIKCGNSLVSRFAIDAHLGQALKKSKWTIDSYRLAVSTYRNARNKEEKREMERLMVSIKNDFRSEIADNDPKLQRLHRIKGQLYELTNQTSLFEQSKKEKREWNAKMVKLTDEIKKLEGQIEEIKNNKIFENAFEWRFEFPEVLNEEGDFVGFDVVIGNPPYMRVQEIQASQPTQKLYYETLYQNAIGSYDLANIFFELSVNISSEHCNNAYIFPHKFLNANSAEVFRNYLMEGQYIDEIAHFGANMVFDDADTYTCVAQYSKKASNGFYFQRFPFRSNFKSLMLDKSKYTFITYEMIEKASQLYGSNQWILFDDEIGFAVFEKIYNQASSIKDKFSRVSQGIATGRDALYLFEGIEQENYIVGNFIKDSLERKIEKGIMKPILKGKDIQRYSSPNKALFILFPYKVNEEGKAVILNETEIKTNFPNAYQWLKETEDIHRKKDNRSTNDSLWFRYARSQGVDYIEQPKLSSMEICASHPNVIFNTDDFYHNTKVYSWYKKEDTTESYEYLLAIANSNLLWWFLKTTGDTLQGDARTFKTNYLNPFPLPIEVDESSEQAITEKVKNVLAIKKQSPSADTTHLESQIDQLVYQLYDLTEEEIAIVENA